MVAVTFSGVMIVVVWFGEDVDDFCGGVSLVSFCNGCKGGYGGRSDGGVGSNSCDRRYVLCCGCDVAGERPLGCDRRELLLLPPFLRE